MAKQLESCGKAVERYLPEAPTGDHDGRYALDVGSVARPRSRGRSEPCIEAPQAHQTTGPPGLTRKKVRPARGFRRLIREKTRPASPKTPKLGCFQPAGRTFSRTEHSHVATLKPPSPLHAPNKGPLKPSSPLQPKNTPQTPISHPQRRRRFQLRLGLREQRR